MLHLSLIRYLFAKKMCGGHVYSITPRNSVYSRCLDAVVLTDTQNDAPTTGALSSDTCK